MISYYSKALALWFSLTLLLGEITRASVSRYNVTDLQATYGNDLNFFGLSKNGILSARSSPGFLSKVENRVRADLDNTSYITPFNNQGFAYRYPDGPGEPLTKLTPDGTVRNTGYIQQAVEMTLSGQNRLGVVVGQESGELTTGTYPSGGFIYDPATGGRIVQEMGGVDVIHFHRVNDAGYLAGFGITQDDTAHGGLFLWITGQPAIQLLPTEGYAQALEMNEAGQVVGWDGVNAFIWKSGTLNQPIRFNVPDPGRPGIVNQVGRYGNFGGVFRLEKDLAFQGRRALGCGRI